MRFAVVVGDEGVPSAGDQVWAAAVTAGGHTPEYVSCDAPDLASRLSDCGAAVTTGSVNYTSLGDQMRLWPYPTCFVAGSTANPWFTNGLTENSSASSGSTILWTMVPPPDALQAGRTGTQNPWAAGVTRHVLGGVAGSTPLAYLNAVTTRWCYFKVPTGTALAGGGVAPALRIAIAGDNAAVATPSAAYADWQSEIVEALAAAAPPPPADSVPVVSASVAPTAVSSGGTFTLTGTETLSPGASEVTARSWTAVTVGAPTLTGATTAAATGTASTPGDYVYSYRATNGAGQSTAAQVTLAVLAVTSRSQFWDGNSYEPRRRHVYRTNAYLDLSDASTGVWPPA